jgi:hypothetical protein
MCCIYLQGWKGLETCSSKTMVPTDKTTRSRNIEIGTINKIHFDVKTSNPTLKWILTGTSEWKYGLYFVWSKSELLRFQWIVGSIKAYVLTNWRKWPINYPRRLCKLELVTVSQSSTRPVSIHVALGIVSIKTCKSSTREAKAQIEQQQQDITTLKTDIHIYYIQKLSSYFTENTLRVHYKDYSC